MIPRAVAGIWSIVATFLLVVFLGYYMGGFEVVLPEMYDFISGNVDAVKRNHSTFAMMVPIILAVLALDLPLSIGAGVLQALILGKPKGEHALSQHFQNSWWARWPRMTKSLHTLHSTTREVLVGDQRKEGSLFKHFFILVLIEELFARELFLAWLHKIPYLDGSVGFYFLFFVGNGIWALIHLSNFKLYEDRHPLRVAPQFVSGVFFSYVFVKYGLMAALITHFAANALLFATHKVQETDFKDLIITGVAAAYAGVSYYCMRMPLSDTLQWFSEEPVFAIAGWEFRDYLTLMVFVPTALATVFGVLLYDRNGLNESDSKTAKVSVKTDSAAAGCLGACIGLVLILMLYVGIIFGIYYLAGLFIASVPIRIVAISIYFSFRIKSSSGSSMARTFWTALPGAYVTICTVHAIGFWDSTKILPLLVLILLPWGVLRKIDD